MAGARLLERGNTMESDVKYLRIDKELRFKGLRVRLAFGYASDEPAKRLMVDLFEVGDGGNTWNLEHDKAAVVGFDNMVVKAVQNAYWFERTIDGFCSEPPMLDCMTGELATPDGHAVGQLSPQHVANAFATLSLACYARNGIDWETLGAMFSDLGTEVAGFPKKCLNLMGLDADGIRDAYAQLDCRVVFKKTSKRWTYEPWAQVCDIIDGTRIMDNEEK